MSEPNTKSTLTYAGGLPPVERESTLARWALAASIVACPLISGIIGDLIGSSLPAITRDIELGTTAVVVLGSNVLAAVLSIVAWVGIEKSGGAIGGRGFAKAATLLSCIWWVGGALFLVSATSH